jgi:hypothetical protein
MVKPQHCTKTNDWEMCSLLKDVGKRMWSSNSCVTSNTNIISLLKDVGKHMWSSNSCVTSNTRRVTVMLSDTNIISLEIVFDTSRRTYPVIYCSNIHVKQHKPIDKRYSLLFLVIMCTSTLTKREEKLSEKVSDKTEVDVIKIIYIIILIIKLVVGYS